MFEVHIDQKFYNFVCFIFCPIEFEIRILNPLRHHINGGNISTGCTNVLHLPWQSDLKVQSSWYWLAANQTLLFELVGWVGDSSWFFCIPCNSYLTTFLDLKHIWIFSFNPITLGHFHPILFEFWSIQWLLRLLFRMIAWLVDWLVSRGKTGAGNQALADNLTIFNFASGSPSWFSNGPTSLPPHGESAET